MYVTPQRLTPEEDDFARLMQEPPTPYSEAVAFATAVEDQEER